jgi:hypothetical protein
MVLVNYSHNIENTFHYFRKQSIYHLEEQRMTTEDGVHQHKIRQR